MMGCGSSMDINTVSEDATNGVVRLQQNGMSPTDVVQEFVRLDEQISKLEATCPGPRMATAEAWIEHLQSKLNALLGIEGGDKETAFNQHEDKQIGEPQHEHLEQQHYIKYVTPTVYTNGEAGGASTTTTAATNGALPNGVCGFNSTGNVDMVSAPSQDLANLALNLGVVSDVRKASTHEDFFANLSETSLQQTTVHYYSEVLEHTKVRLKTLLDSFAELNELYVNHDGIIALISGGTYMTRLEESLDAQLETTRDIRDKLGSALEQWRICGLLLRACASSATLALQQWRALAKIVTPRDKIINALQCRNTLQASLISLDCAQLSLPHVDIQHISNRQTLAVKHCNTYMITDIADKARYEHTTKVFVAYEGNMSKASAWLYETFNKTLRKDFDKAEETVRQLAKTLREHREEVFTAARR